MAVAGLLCLTVGLAGGPASGQLHWALACGPLWAPVLQDRTGQPWAEVCTWGSSPAVSCHPSHRLPRLVCLSCSVWQWSIPLPACTVLVQINLRGCTWPRGAVPSWPTPTPSSLRSMAPLVKAPSESSLGQTQHAQTAWQVPVYPSRQRAQHAPQPASSLQPDLGSQVPSPPQQLLPREIQTQPEPLLCAGPSLPAGHSPPRSLLRLPACRTLPPTSPFLPWLCTSHPIPHHTLLASTVPSQPPPEQGCQCSPLSVVCKHSSQQPVLHRPNSPAPGLHPPWGQHPVPGCPLPWSLRAAAPLCCSRFTATSR